MMSSSDRLATTGFINAAAFPALEPCRISKSCRVAQKNLQPQLS
jgi:hypothetical protein